MVIAMRAVVFLVVLWLTPFLYFGWRVWATWPTRQQRERQRHASRLYDRHFEARRRRSYGDGKQAHFGSATLASSATFLSRRGRTLSRSGAREF